jgi:hypothetical protein
MHHKEIQGNRKRQSIEERISFYFFQINSPLGVDSNRGILEILSQCGASQVSYLQQPLESLSRFIQILIQLNFSLFFPALFVSVVPFFLLHRNKNAAGLKNGSSSHDFRANAMTSMEKDSHKRAIHVLAQKAVTGLAT